ncbi:MAG: TraB/GumN family protein [Sphingobacteriales bacterium]|nr:MAG: TraB/GumN family protein [Sphingobacteriales bacterium]
MNIYSKILLLILLFFLPAFRAHTQEKTLLWRISGNGLSKDSYLFGTMHKICEEDYFWTDTMKKYFHRADRVCFEIDLSNPFLILSTIKSMQSVDGRTLKDLFTPKDFAKLATYFKRANGYDIMLFNQVRPSILMLLLETDYVNCLSFKSYEDEIKQEARKFDKPMLGLETVAEQFAAVAAVTDKEVITYVMNIVNGQYLRDKSHQMLYARIAALYKQQNIRELYDIISTDSTALFDKKEMVLDFRNKNWIPKMKAYSKDKSVFYAVGAGHLAGEAGLISLLRKEGYQLKPVFSEELNFDEILTEAHAD